MKNKQEQIREIVEVILFELPTKANKNSLINEYTRELESLLSQSRQEAVEEALTILDKAETEHWFVMPDTTDNWKTWKRIRNAITDLGGDK